MLGLLTASEFPGSQVIWLFDVFEEQKGVTLSSEQQEKLVNSLEDELRRIVGSETPVGIVAKEPAEVVWEHEVDYALDNDPPFANLIGRTDKGHPVIPAIVSDADTVTETLRLWGWTAHDVVVREYSEDEISELGLVTYPQIRNLVESA